jgi:hypothetical protein
MIEAQEASVVIKKDTQVLAFGQKAHGFKLSAQYDNKIYFYPDGEYKMDMRIIEAGKWFIEHVIEDRLTAKIVILKRSK